MATLELSSEQRLELISLLTRCTYLKKPQGRQALIEKLAQNIQNRVLHADDMLTHLINIVNTSLDYGQLPELLGMVGYFEQGSTEFVALKEWAGVQQIVVVVPTGQPDGLPAVERRPVPSPPVPPKHFAGREQELADLKAALATEDERTVTALRAMGGVGKTSLARQLANQVWPQPFKAVLWTEVKPHPDLAHLLDSWADYFDPEFSFKGLSNEQAARLIKSGLENLIGEGRTLLVFDDVWDDEGVEAITLLLEAAPADSQVLVTTRSALVAERLSARTVELECLPTAEAVVMLNQYLNDKGLPQADLERLAELLEGHALALTLAAKRLNLEGTNAARALPRHLAQYEKGLPEGSAVERLKLKEDTTYREENLALALGYSYEALTDEQKRRFRALGVLAYDQPFDEYLLQAIWNVQPPTDTPEGWEVVEEQCHEWANELRYLSLLENKTETELDDTWHRQHPLLHSLSLRLLKADPAEYAVVLDRYHDRAVKIAADFETLPPQDWKEQLYIYLPQLVKAGQALVAGVADPAASKEVLLRALDFAFNISSYLARRREVRHDEWLEMGLMVSRRLEDKPHESFFLNALGLLYQDLAQNDQAITYFNEALTIQETLGEPGGQVLMLSNLGTVYYYLGQLQKSLEYHEKALALEKEGGDQTAQAFTLNHLGLVYTAFSDTAKALSFYEQALDLWRALEDGSGEATTLGNLAEVYRLLGEPDKALAYYEQSLPVVQAVGDKGDEANLLNNIGIVYDDLGNSEKALFYYEQALVLQQAVGDRNEEATVLNNIGAIYLSAGDHAKALTYFQQALPLHEKAGDQAGTAATLNNIGMAYFNAEDTTKALSYFEQALPLYQAASDRGGEANTRNNIGQLYQSLGDTKKALSYYKEALALSRAIGDRSSEGEGLYNLGQLYREQGKTQLAGKTLKQALTLLKAVRSPLASQVEADLAQLQ